MKKKINLRLVFIAVIAILATVIGLTIVYYGIFQKQVRNDLEVTARLLDNTGYFEDQDRDVSAIDLSSDIGRLRVTWIAADGTVLYDNDKSADTLENHADRPEIQSAFATGSGESVRRSDTMNRNTYYYALLLDNGTVIRVAMDARNFWSVLASSVPLMLLIIAAIIGVCILLSHLLTRQLIEPIEVMAQNIEDPSVEAPYKELVPFTNMIRQQHTDILSAAKARQDFTANVSHELKTPLTAISGYVELMENHMVEPDQEEHFLGEIRKNSDRLISLINDSIRLSEMDRAEKTPKFEVLDLSEVVGDCIDALKVNADRRGVKLSYESQQCTVRGNREMIKELTDNLVQNAIRYNNEGGNVWVTVRCDEEAMLIVKDNGIGIPAAEQERVFERFYRVDKSRSKATGGTGLGLAIVKHIVELHDARITLDSAPGIGTTITVFF